MPAARGARRLQDVVTPITRAREGAEDGGEVRIAGSERHGGAAPDPVLHVDVADARAVGVDLFRGVESERSAIADVVVDAELRSQIGDETRQAPRGKVRLERHAQPEPVQLGSQGSERAQGVGFLLRRLDASGIHQRNHQRADAERRACLANRTQVAQALLTLLAGRLVERGVHEEIAGERADRDAVARLESRDLPPARLGHERILVQALGVERPFHQAETGRRRERELVAPMRPGERLDLALHRRREPALHEANARSGHYRPFAVQPPSTKRSVPVT